MKTYQSFVLLLAALGAFGTSCENELKQETTFDVAVKQGENVSVEGTTVTVQKGVPLTFTLDGDPDFITFFSGETGHEYVHKNRTEMTAADVVKCNLSLSIWAQYGDPKNILSVYISDSFPGLAKNNFEADSVLVEQFAWTELIPQDQLPQKAVANAQGATPYDFDLKSYLGKKITLAIRYKGISNTGPQSKFYFVKMQMEKAFNNGQSEIKPANGFGLTPVNMDNKKKFADQSKAVYRPQADNKEYGYVTGGIAGLWNLNDPTNIFIQSSAKGADLKYSWLVSDPIAIDNLCNPDTGVPVKNVTQSVREYTHTYNEAGTYTVTFVGSNANFEHRGEQVVRELTVKVTE